MPPAFALSPVCPFCPGATRSACTPLRSVRRLRVLRRAAPRMLLGDNGGARDAPDAPEGRVISKALEVSFRNVWIRLMTQGIGPEYDEAIQTFVVTCIAAYKVGYSITALKLELSANELKDQYMGRDISLNDQEKETRLVWIMLVYLTLTRFQFESDRSPPPVSKDMEGSPLEKLVPGLTGLTESVCDAAQKGYNLQTYKMELSLKNQLDTKPLSSAEASIRSQWARIVFATYNMLPDALKSKPR